MISLRNQMGLDMFRNLVLLVILFFPPGMSSCIQEKQSNTFRRGNVEMEKLDVDDFSAIKLNGNYLVTLENADSCSVEAAIPDEKKDLLISEVRSDVLIMKTIEATLNNHDVIELVIKAPKIDRIEVFASVRLISEKPFEFDNLRLESSGALNVEMELKGNYLDADLSGATKLDLRGEVKNVVLNIPGAGKISAYDLVTENLELILSGAGKAQVYASKKLNVDLSGACSVTYKGDPSEIFTNVSGIGRVREVK
jgi:hypothetical protein